MPSLPDEIGLALWTRACAAEIGIAIKTRSKPFLKSELYRIRKESGLSEFDSIIICDPKGEEIFMVKKTTEVE